jgi:hypothetical protein
VTAEAARAAARTWFLANFSELTSRLWAFFSRLGRDARAEAVQDCLAVIWLRTLSAAAAGKPLDDHTPYNAAVFAGKAYKCGRRFAGSSVVDAMADGTRLAGRATAQSVEEWVPTEDDLGRPDEKPLHRLLADPRNWNDPFEAARVRHDYPAVLDAECVGSKARAVFAMLAQTHGSAPVGDMAAALHVTPARVCQLRTQLADALSRRGYGPANWPVAVKRRGRRRVGTRRMRTTVAA